MSPLIVMLHSIGVLVRIPFSARVGNDAHSCPRPRENDGQSLAGPLIRRGSRAASLNPGARRGRKAPCLPNASGIGKRKKRVDASAVLHREEASGTCRNVLNYCTALSLCGVPHEENSRRTPSPHCPPHLASRRRARFWSADVENAEHGQLNRWSRRAAHAERPCAPSRESRRRCGRRAHAHGRGANWRHPRLSPAGATG